MLHCVAHRANETQHACLERLLQYRTAAEKLCCQRKPHYLHRRISRLHGIHQHLLLVQHRADEHRVGRALRRLRVRKLEPRAVAQARRQEPALGLQDDPRHPVPGPHFSADGAALVAAGRRAGHLHVAAVVARVPDPLLPAAERQARGGADQDAPARLLAIRRQGLPLLLRHAHLRRLRLALRPDLGGLGQGHARRGRVPVRLGGERDELAQLLPGPQEGLRPHRPPPPAQVLHLKGCVTRMDDSDDLDG
mmetsp:Transcript_13167/g.28123  ORF Transcript_13167/g.28123 Transcript_13167/m.28123 type:complete len:250 (+) Transcript_13167:397-1146(+)